MQWARLLGLLLGVVSLSFSLCVAAADVPNIEDLLSSVGGLKQATDSQSSTRNASRQAKASLLKARLAVEVLERELAQAKNALLRNESLYQEAIEAEQNAKHAMQLQLSKLAAALGPEAANLSREQDAAPNEMEEEAVDTTTGRVLRHSVPGPSAMVVLYERAKLKGRSVQIRCCGAVQLADMLKEARIMTVKSIQVPEGMKVTLTVSTILQDDERQTLDTFGSLHDIDKTLNSYRFSCCSHVDISSGVVHNEGTSVVLYEEADFQGASASYLEGDYGPPPISRVGSLRVPPGLQLTAYEHEEDFSTLSFRRDSATFPSEETDQLGGYRRHVTKVVRLSVRRLRQEDMHGLLIFSEKAYAGRPQFFESGRTYRYPPTWKPIYSMLPSNRTSAVLDFAGSKQLVVKGNVPNTREFGVHNVTPATIEVRAHCDPPDYCGPFGTCIAPQQCRCEGSHQGARCNLQMPDETSVFMCDGNAVVVGEPLTCRFFPRRDSDACNATTVFLKVDLNASLSAVANITGSPLIKPNGVPKQRSMETSSFEFEVIFGQPGVFLKPFLLEILGSEEPDVFCPSIEVLERCDGPGIVADVRCQRNKSAMLDCALQLRLSHNGVETQEVPQAWRCPLAALKVYEVGKHGGLVNLRTEGGDAASDTFLFNLRLSALARALTVEVQHGLASGVLRLGAHILEQFDASLEDEAEALLRAGDTLAALRVLQECPAENQPCIRLHASLLLRLGQFDKAEALAGVDGSEHLRRQVGIVRNAVAEAESANERDDYMAALTHFGHALKLAPLSSQLRVQRSEAAAMAGEFDQAADDARFARRLGSTEDGGVGALRALGLAFLGLGLTEVSLQNLRGCGELESLAGQGDESPCRRMIFLVKTMEKKIKTLESYVWEEAWENSAETARNYLRLFSAAWPSFRRSTWGLQASAALCQAHLVINVSQLLDDDDSIFDAGMEPCLAVTQAPEPMQARLAAFEVLKCNMGVAAWHLAREREERSLEAVEAAEAVLREASTDPRMDDERIDQLKKLRELIQEQSRQSRGEDSNSKDSSRKTKEPEKPQDHYDVLGILGNATLAEIKSAYRKLALKYHPDKNDDPTSLELFLKVQKAYNVLSEEDLRRRYDSGDLDVDKEVGKKNMKPVERKVIKVDAKRGVATVWWRDPNTGEEGTVEMDIGGGFSDEEGTAGSSRRPLREHCCLPGPAADQ